MPTQDLFDGTGYFTGSGVRIHPANAQALGRSPVAEADDFFFGDDTWEQTLILVGIGVTALYLYYRKK